MIRVARHGETTWNVESRYQGRRESPLSPLGERQAAALARYFAARREAGDRLPERIVTSPLGRCRTTAGPTAELLGVAIETDPRLIEIGHGDWETRLKANVMVEDPERFRAWKHDPAHVVFAGRDAEALTDVLARWRSFAGDLARETRDTLVVTHDAVARCSLVDMLGRPLDDFWAVHVENAAFSEVETDGARLRVVTECVVEHLAALRAATDSQAL